MFSGLFYPPTCVLCRRILSECERDVCRECQTKRYYITGITCLKCGKEISCEEQEYCQDCENRGRTYERGFPAMEYKEPMTDALWDFKYNNMRIYGAFFAREIVKVRGAEISKIAPEALVPVPVHKSKLIKRGYNQAEVLAVELGRLLDIPVKKDLIQRIINTLPQKELNDEEREKNLKRAFVCTDKIVKYNKLMLVDDIYTTGATVEACSWALKNKGVNKIYYTSVCIGRGN